MKVGSKETDMHILELDERFEALRQSGVDLHCRHERLKFSETHSLLKTEWVKRISNNTAIPNFAAKKSHFVPFFAFMYNNDSNMALPCSKCKIAFIVSYIAVISPSVSVFLNRAKEMHTWSNFVTRIAEYFEKKIQVRSAVLNLQKVIPSFFFIMKTLWFIKEAGLHCRHWKTQIFRNSFTVKDSMSNCGKANDFPHRRMNKSCKHINGLSQLH